MDESKPVRPERTSGWWRLAVVVAGLGAGVLSASFIAGRGGSSSGRATPSVERFEFPTAVPAAPMPTVETPAAPPPQTEPTDPATAVSLLLQALVDGRPEAAYGLLDEPSRSRLPSLSAWLQAQASQPRPVTFSVVGTQVVPGGADVEVTVTHRPSLDVFTGLVPGASRQVWPVRHEGDRWRVAAQPRTVTPILPVDAGAPDPVRQWVSASSGCDAQGARRLQAVGDLIGPADLAAAPCARRGEWTVGQPLGLDRLPDPAALLAAFGPETSSWARVVPVRGPGTAFLVAVAPLGDSWRVIGVGPDRPEPDSVLPQ